MKKLLLAALFIIGMSSVASAQQKHGYSQTTYITEKRAPKKLAPVEPGYQSTISISYSYGSLAGGHVFFFEYIGGYRFNNTLFLGAGIGLGFTKNAPRLEGWKSHEYSYTNSWTHTCRGSIYGTGITYRLYVNGRFYLSKTRLQPFLGAAIGFEGYKTGPWYDGCNDPYYHEYGHKAGFYAMPEVGLNYRISNRTSAFLSIGYGATLCNSGLQVKVGATF